MKPHLARRQMLATSAAALAFPSAAQASPRDLTWKELVPLRARGAPQPGVISHSVIPSRTFTDPRHFAIVPDLEGEYVRLPGFLVPLDFEGLGATEFLLVPFVGACIHVPPPPPNQLVHALAERPYEMEGLFAPVYAVGTLRGIYSETGIAQVSYQMDVQDFEEVSF